MPRSGRGFAPPEPSGFERRALCEQALFALVGWGPAVVGLYDRQNLLDGTLGYGMIFRETTLGVLLSVALEFLNLGHVIARGWLLAAWATIFIFVAAGRFALRRVIYSLCY